MMTLTISKINLFYFLLDFEIILSLKKITIIIIIIQFFILKII
jgi:hypothetical protein